MAPCANRPLVLAIVFEPAGSNVVCWSIMGDDEAFHLGTLFLAAESQLHVAVFAMNIFCPSVVFLDSS